MRRISDERGETLRHLRELGIVPNAPLEVTRAIENEGVQVPSLSNYKKNRTRISYTDETDKHGFLEIEYSMFLILSVKPVRSVYEIRVL